MHSHPTHPGELAAFAAVGTPPGQTAAVYEYLERMVAQGAMRPEWCFVAEDNNGWLARAAYWTLPRVGIPLDIVLFDLPLDGEYLTLEAQLLGETLPAMRAAGALAVGHVVDSPPQWVQWQDHIEQRHRLLTHFGFKVERQPMRFELKPVGEQPAPRHRLRFQSLAELNEAVLIDAIQQVSAGTYDQRIRHERNTRGPENAARREFTDLQAMEYDPRWWQLAYASDGALVGPDMATRAPTFSTIGYIGVVPEQRGKGYVDDLLAQGTTTLLAAGATIIRVDTDVANTPIENAFQRAGYAQFAPRSEYRRDVGTGP